MLFKRLAYFLLFSLAFKCYAQSTVLDSIISRMEIYGSKVPQSALFVHFDKTVYTNNELIWFTGYLLQAPQSELHHTLSVALIKNDERAVISEHRFMMRNGVAMGDFRLSDSIQTGNYSLITYTNRVANGLPEAIFIQPITIKTTKEPPFTATLRIVDSVAADGYLKILLEGYTKDKMLLAGAAIKYSTGSGKVISGPAVKTDVKGEYLFKIPIGQVNEKNSLLSAQISFGKEKESREIKIRLPVARPVARVSFFPEGGYLINGLQTFVGWEITTEAGSPLNMYATLFKNNIPVDTIQSNSMGIGKFVLRPEADANYTVKLLDTSWSRSSYSLPKVLMEGYLVTVREAITNDTLRFTLRSTRPGNITLMVHNFKQVYLTSSFQMKGTSQFLKIPLADVPRGICTLTILDSLGRPFAERLFFAHEDKQEVLTISSDKPTYTTREKVTLHLELLKDWEGKLNKALVSIACVQENRLEVLNKRDIESYVYLESQLNAMPLYPHREIFDSKQALENILLVKGWRKYTWPELVLLSPQDSIVKRSSLNLGGRVTKNGKTIRSPADINVINPNGFNQVQSDSTGNFIFTPSSILLQPDKKLLISVNDRQSANFKITILNPYERMNKLLGETLDPINDSRPVFETSTQSLLLNRNERSITMTEVKLSTRKDNSLYGTMGQANPCGDYVCRYNILNCPNHFGDSGNKPAQAGQRYMQNGQQYFYSGCTAPAKDEHILTIEGIYTNREFYGSDYSKNDSPLPEYFSTIYWNHGIMLEPDGTAKVSFYTSDITGNYKVIVQGISAKDVIYAEYTFPVTKKKP